MDGCWLIPSCLEVIPSSQKLTYLLLKGSLMAGMRDENRAPSYQDGVLHFLLPVTGCMRLVLLVAIEKS